jgi:hypothetical protein
MTDIKTVHVPYRGETFALTDILSRQVDVLFISGTVSIHALTSPLQAAPLRSPTIESRSAVVHQVTVTSSAEQRQCVSHGLG